MKLYREWARQLSARHGTMVPVEQFDRIIKCVRDPGYSSVYAFSEEAAKEIEASGMSRGFDKFETISDTLPIDLDDGGASWPALQERLKGLRYERYFSGSKGMHVILHHEPIQSMDLPYSHKNVVKSFNTAADMTLYQAGRILSLPGRIHPKTKKPKTLIEVVEGDLIEVPLVEKPPVDFNFGETLGGDVEVALFNLLGLQTSPPPDGLKHIRLWQVSTDLFKAGFTHSAVAEFILKIVAGWATNLSEEDIMKPIDQAWRRLHG